MVWNNDDLVLYHGCTEQSLRQNNPKGIALDTDAHGIDPTLGAVARDFGPGFYTTTWLEQARSWANLRSQKLGSLGPPLHRAVVVEFAVRRNDLADLETLVFTNEKGDYWPFVEYCRLGGQPHARSDCAQAEYDIVYGPVSIWTQPFVIKDFDQISFHTARAVSKIPSVRIAEIGTPLF